MGDVTYGILSFEVAGHFAPEVLARFALGCILAAVVFLSFLVLVQSLAFCVGHVGLIASQAMNAVITFVLYPLHLFDGTAKLLLFTVIPAAFVGAVPAEFVTEFTELERLTVLHSHPNGDYETRLLLDRLSTEFPDVVCPTVLFSPVLATQIGPHGLGVIIFDSKAGEADL